MTELFMVKYYLEKRAVGLFTTLEKAKIAAKAHMEFVLKIDGHKKEIKIDDKVKEEIFFYVEEEDTMNIGRYTLVIEKWIIDKALIDNEWVIL